MFTVKATYRNETRKFSFTGSSEFPTYQAIQDQLYRVFPISHNVYISKVLFSPGGDSAGRILLILEAHSESEYEAHVKPYRGRQWPGAVLRFSVFDETPHKLPSTAAATVTSPPEAGRPSSSTSVFAALDDDASAAGVGTGSGTGTGPDAPAPSARLRSLLEHCSARSHELALRTRLDARRTLPPPPSPRHYPYVSHTSPWRWLPPPAPIPAVPSPPPPPPSLRVQAPTPTPGPPPPLPPPPNPARLRPVASMPVLPSGLPTEVPAPPSPPTLPPRPPGAEWRDFGSFTSRAPGSLDPSWRPRPIYSWTPTPMSSIPAPPPLPAKPSEHRVARGSYRDMIQRISARTSAGLGASGSAEAESASVSTDDAHRMDANRRSWLADDLADPLGPLSGISAEHARRRESINRRLRDVQARARERAAMQERRRRDTDSALLDAWSLAGLPASSSTTATTATNTADEKDVDEKTEKGDDSDADKENVADADANKENEAVHVDKGKGKARAVEPPAAWKFDLLYEDKSDAKPSYAPWYSTPMPAPSMTTPKVPSVPFKSGDQSSSTPLGMRTVPRPPHLGYYPFYARDEADDFIGRMDDLNGFERPTYLSDGFRGERATVKKVKFGFDNKDTSVPDEKATPVDNKKVATDGNNVAVTDMDSKATPGGGKMQREIDAMRTTMGTLFAKMSTFIDTVEANTTVAPDCASEAPVQPAAVSPPAEPAASSLVQPATPAPTEPEPVPEAPKPVHRGVRCDVCNKTIEGVRHKCLDCPDYDLCTPCLAQARTRPPLTFNPGEGRLVDGHQDNHIFFAIEEPGDIWVSAPFRAPVTQAPPLVPTVETPKPPVKHNALCDLCDSEIYDKRYKCLQCPDWDVCKDCFTIVGEQHPGHGFVCITDPAALAQYHATRTAPRARHHARCNVCREAIVGVRYKCMHASEPGCADFDLCARCEALPIPVHPPTHPLLKMRAHDAVVPRVLRDGERVLRPEERVLGPDERVLLPGERVLLPGERVLHPDEHVLQPGERVLLPGERVVSVDEREHSHTPDRFHRSRDAIVQSERAIRETERVIRENRRPPRARRHALAEFIESPEPRVDSPPPPLTDDLYSPSRMVSLPALYSPPRMISPPRMASPPRITSPPRMASPPYIPRLPSPPSFRPTSEAEPFPHIDFGNFVRASMPGGLPPTPPVHLPPMPMPGAFPPMSMPMTGGLPPTTPSSFPGLAAISTSWTPPTSWTLPASWTPPTLTPFPVLGGLTFGEFRPAPAPATSGGADFPVHGGASQSPTFPTQLVDPVTFTPPPAPFFPPASSFSPSTASPVTPVHDLSALQVPELVPPPSSFSPSTASPDTPAHDLPVQHAPADFLPSLPDEPTQTREHEEPLITLASNDAPLIDLTQSSSGSQSRDEPASEFASLSGSAGVDEPLTASHRTEGELGPMLPQVPQTDLHELSDLAAHFRQLWAQGSGGARTPKTDSPAKAASEAVSAPTDLASSSDDALSASRVEEAWSLKERVDAENQQQQQQAGAQEEDAYAAAVAKYTQAATGGLYRLSQALEMVQSAEASQVQSQAQSQAQSQSLDSPPAAQSPLSAVELLSTPRRPLARSNILGSRTLAELFGGAGSLRVAPPSTSAATTSRPTTMLSTSSRPTSLLTDDSSTIVGAPQPDALRAAYIADNNIPDGQVFPPGAEFVKSWAMRNEGSSPWPETTELVFVAGDRLQIEGVSGDRFKVGSVEPGAEVDIWTGEMKAPDVPGKYISYWRLSDGKGNRFGHSIWVDITVIEPAESAKADSESSLSSSSIVMPQPPSTMSQSQPAAAPETTTGAATEITTAEDDDSASSSMSFIDMPSDEESDVFEDSRSQLEPPAPAPAPRAAEEYVVLYDSSDDEDL